MRKKKKGPSHTHTPSFFSRHPASGARDLHSYRRTFLFRQMAPTNDPNQSAPMNSRRVKYSFIIETIGTSIPPDLTSITSNPTQRTELETTCRCDLWSCISRMVEVKDVTSVCEVGGPGTGTLRFAGSVVAPLSQADTCKGQLELYGGEPLSFRSLLSTAQSIAAGSPAFRVQAGSVLVEFDGVTPPVKVEPAVDHTKAPERSLMTSPPKEMCYQRIQDRDWQLYAQHDWKERPAHGYKPSDLILGSLPATSRRGNSEEEREYEMWVRRQALMPSSAPPPPPPMSRSPLRAPLHYRDYQGVDPVHEESARHRSAGYYRGGGGLHHPSAAARSAPLPLHPSSHYGGGGHYPPTDRYERRSSPRGRQQAADDGHRSYVTRGDYPHPSTSSGSSDARKPSPRARPSEAVDAASHRTTAARQSPHRAALGSEGGAHRSGMSPYSNSPRLRPSARAAPTSSRVELW